MMTDNKVPTYDLVVDRSDADRTTFTVVRDGKPIGQTQVTNALVRDIIHNLYWGIIGNEK